MSPEDRDEEEVPPGRGPSPIQNPLDDKEEGTEDEGEEGTGGEEAPPSSSGSRPPAIELDDDENDFTPIGKAPPMRRARGVAGRAQARERGGEDPKNFSEFSGEVSVGPLFKSENDIILSVGNYTEADPASRSANETIKGLKVKLDAARQANNTEDIKKYTEAIAKHERVLADIEGLDVTATTSTRLGNKKGLKMIRSQTEGGGAPVDVYIYRGNSDKKEWVKAGYTGKPKAKREEFSAEMKRWNGLALEGAKLQATATYLSTKRATEVAFDDDIGQLMGKVYAPDPAAAQSQSPEAMMDKALADAGAEGSDEIKSKVAAEKSRADQELEELRNTIEIENEDGTLIKGAEAVSQLQVEADKIFAQMAMEMAQHYEGKLDDPNLSDRDKAKIIKQLESIAKTVELDQKLDSMAPAEAIGEAERAGWSKILPSFKDRQRAITDYREAMKQYVQQRERGYSGARAAEKAAIAAYRINASIDLKRDRFIQLIISMMMIELKEMGEGVKSFTPGSQRDPDQWLYMKSHMGGDIINRMANMPVNLRFSKSRGRLITKEDEKGRVIQRGRRLVDPETGRFRHERGPRHTRASDTGRGLGPGGRGLRTDIDVSHLGLDHRDRAKQAWITEMFHNIVDSQGIRRAKQFKQLAESVNDAKDLTGAGVVLFGFIGEASSLNGLAGTVLRDNGDLLVKIKNQARLHNIFSESAESVLIDRENIILVTERKRYDTRGEDRRWANVAEDDDADAAYEGLGGAVGVATPWRPTDGSGPKRRPKMSEEQLMQYFEEMGSRLDAMERQLRKR